METTLNPLTLDDRLRYLQLTTENCKNNSNKFQLGTLLLGLLIGGGIVYAIKYFPMQEVKEH